MANTSNIGLAKLEGTEKLKTFPTTFNADMDTIDTVVGNDVGTSRTISQAITKTEEGIAIVANGNTHSAISSGQYVYVKNHGSLAEGLYTASSAISANATLSGSNLTAVSGGGLNSVYSALNGKIANPESISTGITGVTANKMGGIVILRIEINTAIGGTSATWYEIGTLPTALKPLETVYFTGYDNNSSGVEATQIRIVTNGKIYIWLPANKNAKPYGTVTYVV